MKKLTDFVVEFVNIWFGLHVCFKQLFWNVLCFPALFFCWFFRRHKMVYKQKCLRIIKRIFTRGSIVHFNFTRCLSTRVPSSELCSLGIYMQKQANISCGKEHTFCATYFLSRYPKKKKGYTIEKDFD